ncbi:MAG: TolB family protein [Gemmatimonadota bacterium]
MTTARRMMYRVATVMIALATPPTLLAQMPLITRLSSVQNPPGIEWWRIDTPHFTVIHPAALAREAQRAASLLERDYGRLSNSLPARPERIPVVLNNQSLVTNAFVAWSPRRSQWYSMPNTTVDAFGPIDWYSLLSIHEGRHIVQEKAVRRGWIGLASRLFGDNTTAFLGSLYFPAWLWEGDAVGAETGLSDGGRGGVPSFTARTRALMSVGKPYNYHAAWHGSYRTIYPDWYEQGYAITTWLRRHHGDASVAQAISGSVWNPLVPFALPMAVRRLSGKSLTSVNTLAQAEIDSIARLSTAGVGESAAERQSPRRSGYGVWSQPQFAGDGSIIATYTDLDTPPQLVRLAGGRKEVLVERTGIVGDLTFHVRGDRVVWSEYEVDPRYGERSWLSIRSLDLASREVTRLTTRTRYIGPSLSPDGSRIAAIHFGESREATLVILDAGTGIEQQRLAARYGRHLVAPSWSPDGGSVDVVAVDTVRGNALVRVALDGGAERVLIDYSFEGITRPTAFGRWVLHGSQAGGVDNIRAVDTVSLERFRVTWRRLGASWPSVSPDGNRLLFSDLGADGHDAVVADLRPAEWSRPTTEAVDRGREFWRPLREQERRLEAANGGDASIVDAETWTRRRYRGLSTLLDFHSLSISPASDETNVGYVLESRNVLNTFGLMIGGSFSSEGTFAGEVGASYAGLPVIIDAAARLGSRASTFEDSTGATRGFSWNERSLTTALRFPLTRINGLTRQSLTLATAVSLTRITDQEVRFRFDNGNGSFSPVTYSLAASHAKAAAHRDMLQTGAGVAATFRHTPLAGDYEGRLLSARSVLVTPGVIRNHNLVLDAGHEQQLVGNYRFSRLISLPRGFSSRFHEQFAKAGVTYHLPLLYPDLAVSHLVFARRIQGNLFADVGRGRLPATRQSPSRVVDYRSAGGEVTGDFAFFGTRTTTRLGVRWTRRFTGDGRLVSEFVIQLPQ